MSTWIAGICARRAERQAAASTRRANATWLAEQRESRLQRRGTC